jgi:hypothetical protein
LKLGHRAGKSQRGWICMIRSRPTEVPFLDL